MAINITQNTINAVQTMVQESFIANSKVDRMKSVLGVDLAFNKMAERIHLDIAHYFSGHMGDGLGDLLEGYNQPILYGDIPKAHEEYFSVDEILKALLDLCIDYQNKLNECARIAKENMDLHIYNGLMDLVEDFSGIVQQCILLVDKSKIFKDNPTFDNFVDDFWIL